MKSFDTYQYVGGKMSPRDKKEAESKFWNKGKWDNFILPFLPGDCSELSFVDLGCNAGLFLKLAEDMGFDKVIGVDSNKEAIQRAFKYRAENGGKYDIQRRRLERTLKHLPVVDYIVLANVHYYFGIGDWLDFLDMLRGKASYCVLVSGVKRNLPHLAGSSLSKLKYYFRDWEGTGLIDNISTKGDPSPRNLFSVCLKNPRITREKIATLDNGNHQQDGFCKELDSGVDPLRTRYYQRMKSYRIKEHGWTQDQVVEYVRGKANLYKEVKSSGLKNSIVVNLKKRIVDGNHRCEIMKHLGYTSVQVRWVL